MLQIHGPDAKRYLNGQVTQDVRLLSQSAHAALHACVTDAKGRLQGYVTLYQVKEEPLMLWVEAPFELRERLFARLSRYLIADDAEIEDLSDEFQLFHLIDEAPEAGDFSHARYGVEGYDRWVKAGTVLTVDHVMLEDDVEPLRIENAVPRWGRELTEGMLPPEAELERWAISYQKGCYIGQEVISRIKSAGKLNRRLFAFHVESQGIEEGANLLDAEGAEVGTLTSVAGMHALGYLAKKAYGQTNFGVRLPDGNLIDRSVRIKDQR